MIKIVAFAVAIYTVAASLAANVYMDQPFALSVLLGGLSILANIAGLAFSWRLIFMKKSIALAVLVIIFKYLLLGMVLWSLIELKWLSPAGFCIGLGSLVFAVLAAIVFKSVTQKSL